MPAQALYLKWRPRTFDDVIGQEHITRSLRNALVQNRIRHAYLFSGPRGTGKTTMARILAKAVNCLHDDPMHRPCDVCRFCQAVNEGNFLDLIEIDAASHNGVDDVRDLRDKIAFSPSEGRYKVYIIDEVHRFSGAAFDALLKTLEEPPEHAIFVLATTELDKVPATIKSRSLMFEFRRVSLNEVANRLELIATNEGIHAERAALELVARQGTGSVRDSISLLDQLITDPDEPVTLVMAEQVLGTAANRAVGKLAQSIINDDPAAGLDILNQAIDEGADPAQFARQIVEYLRNMLLVQTAGPGLIEVSNEMRATLQEQAAAISRAALIRAVRAFNAAVGEIRGGWQPQLPLELALIESTRPIQDNPSPVDAPAAPRRMAKSAAPEPEEAEAEEESEPPAAPGAISVAEMQNAWPRVHQLLKERNKTLGALLDHARVKNVDGQILVLAVNEAVFKEKLDTDDKRKELAKAVKAVVKVALQIKVVIATKVDDKIFDDPLVNLITSELGGSIGSVVENQNQGGNNNA